MSTQTPPRRRWLRFSLRTLLLFVLLVGSGATLWWNWDLWSAEIVLRDLPDLTQAQLLRHGRGLILHFSRPVENSKLAINDIQYREIPSGRVRYSVRAGNGDGYIRISTGETTLQLFNRSPTAKNMPLVDSWNLETGERLNSDRFFHGSRDISVKFSSGDHFVYVCSDFTGERTLLKYPELTPAGNLGELFKNDFNHDDHFAAFTSRFSPRGTWLLNYVTPNKVQFIGLTSKFEVRELDLAYEPTPEWYGSIFSPDERFLSVQYQSATPRIPQNGMLVYTHSLAVVSVYPQHGLPSHPNFSKSGAFMLLVNLANNWVEIQRADDPKTPLWTSNLNSQYCWIGDNLLRRDSNLAMLDGTTGATLWQKPAAQNVAIGIESSSECIALRDVDNKTLLSLVNPLTGQTELDMRDWSWNRRCGPLHVIQFSEDSTRFMASLNSGTIPNRIKTIVVARRRPGSLKAILLPEFWLTLVLAAAFLWSVWRDRRLGTRL